MAQQKQNIEGMIKKRVLFLNGANFVKAVKVRENDIFKSKTKQDTFRFNQSTHQKVLSPIGCTAAEKTGGGGNFILFSKKQKRKTKEGPVFFLTCMFVV